MSGVSYDVLDYAVRAAAAGEIRNDRQCAGGHQGSLRVRDDHSDEARGEQRRPGLFGLLCIEGRIVGVQVPVKVQNLAQVTLQCRADKVSLIRRYYR